MSTLDELVYYCREENIFGALMLTGKWGCGKTYLIEKELINALGENYVVIRISLFGESAVNSIHKKVQKEFFNKFLDNQDNIIGKAKKQLNNSKQKKVKKFISIVAKNKLEDSQNVALNPYDWIEVENKIKNKNVILIFDDMERCTLNTVDTLGCINEYIENKKIKTIIVANEEKITALNSLQNDDGEEKQNLNGVKESDGEIPYSEVKEKIIVRTLKYIPKYETIIHNILVDYKTKDEKYTKFLIDYESQLTDVFMCGQSENIRSLKCAIQDFERVYSELQKHDINEDMVKYYQSFVAFTLSAKAGKLKKNNSYGSLFIDYEISKEYRGYYDNRIMHNGIQNWSLEGTWDEDGISYDIEKRIKINKGFDSEYLVRNSPYILLEEKVIEESFPKVLEMAYEGSLNIDEYVNLVSNISYMREIGYTLPVIPDMEKLEIGVDKCLNLILETDDGKNRIAYDISDDRINNLTPAERKIYQKISDFRDKEIQVFAVNKRKYITALEMRDMQSIAECTNKKFNIFDEELKEKVLNCYKCLSNGDRNQFMSLFKDSWMYSTIPSESKAEDFLYNFKELNNQLSDLKVEEENTGYKLRAIHTGRFIVAIDGIIRYLSNYLN